MIIQPLFKDSSIGFQLFLFIALLLFGALFGMLFGLIILYFSQGIGLQDIGSSMAEGTNINAIRTLQISSQIGLFVFPPFFFSWLVNAKSLRALGWKSITPSGILVPAIILMFACLPFIHLLTELNQSIHFPEWLSGLEAWMQQKEADAERLTKILLNVTTVNGLIINLFMIALLPALGEELVFRSVLQPLLGKVFKNMHFGIIVSALIFSTMHLQFYGLFPRFALGLFLGYFFYWSGSIWVPVVMHFVNNAAAVIAYYLYHNGHTSVPMDEFGTSANIVYWILSIIFTIGLLYSGYMFAMKRTYTSN